MSSELQQRMGWKRIRKSCLCIYEDQRGRIWTRIQLKPESKMSSDGVKQWHPKIRKHVYPNTFKGQYSNSVLVDDVNSKEKLIEYVAEKGGFGVWWVFCRYIPPYKKIRPRHIAKVIIRPQGEDEYTAIIQDYSLLKRQSWFID